MKKIGVFYGSDSGNTKQIAEKIAKKIGISLDNIFDIGKTPVATLLDYDVLLLGSSTWGAGDLQDDWENSISKLERCDLAEKKVAIFGTGDSYSYSDTFCDAIGTLAQTVQKAGAVLIGDNVNASDYSFDSSTACKDGLFCGLPLDEDNEGEKTDERISAWLEQLLSEDSI